MNSHTTAAKAGSIFLYFGSLSTFLYLVLPNNYLVDIATSYMLKDQLHATAAQISSFRLLTAFPVYVSFLFGLTRDIWNPFGLRDRGYFLLFGTLTAIVFLVLAFEPLSYIGLFVGIFLTMATFRFVCAAYQGLMALVGQEQMMSGRLSALWQIVNSAASLAAGYGAGYVAEYVSSRDAFLFFAFISIVIALHGFWKPRAVFSHAYDQPLARGTNFVGDVKRLVKHRAIYAPIIIILMFQFAPGFNTPMQFYLSNTLHAPDSVYAQFNGIFAAAFIPAFFLYGYLCKKFSLKILLWWGTIITIPQMIPLALIHSGEQALYLAIPMGLMGGIAVGAIYDLTMRSCPPGLQGTLMMVVDGFYLLSTRGSDVLGSVIYDSNPARGFLYCVIATTAMYTAILPVLLLIPKALIATSDGEPNPAVEAELLIEIAETR